MSKFSYKDGDIARLWPGIAVAHCAVREHSESADDAALMLATLVEAFTAHTERCTIAELIDLVNQIRDACPIDGTSSRPRLDMAN